MDDFLAQIEQQIRDVRTGHNIQPVPCHKKHKENNILFIVAIGLMVAIAIFMYKHKKDDIRNWAGQLLVQKTEEVVGKDVTSVLNEILATQEKHKNLLQMVGDRLAVMGAVLNNNTAVSQNKYPVEDYVYISRDWKINQVPKHLNAAPRERGIIEQHSK